MKILLIGTLAAAFAASAPVEPPANRSTRPAAGQLEFKTKVNVPVILCIDDKPTVGGQPSGDAYAKAAANGFRAVLTLRVAKDGVDTLREQFMVEANRMRYFNIPSAAPTPSSKHVDQFLEIARDPKNHPLLVNCAFAERIAPFMLIFRVGEEGWREEKAVEEAVRLGLAQEEMRNFARAYLSKRRVK